MVRPNKAAQAIINSIKYMTIATVDEQGQPWDTPVAVFHFDNDYALYWASWADNQHSKNIRANGKAFIVIYDSTPPSEPMNGVYIKAQVFELTNEEEVLKAALVFKDDPYNPSDGTEYLGGKPRRIYKAIPENIWVNSDHEILGNFVDIRVEAEE